MNRFSLATCGAVVVVFGLSLAACGSGSAKEPTEAEQVAAPAAAKQAVELSPEVEERMKLQREWRSTLTSTKWDLNLKLKDGQQGDTETDVLMFGRRTVESENLLKEGYSQSEDYTLYAPTDESVAWEAMQLKDEDRAIWRGEVLGETINGILTKQHKGGKKGDSTQRFSFTGSLAERPSEVEVQEEAPGAAPDSEALEVDPEA